MALQKLDWGEILWFESEENLVKEKGMKVGMVTLYRGAHQARHLHFEEQVLYVVQGTAVSYIGKNRECVNMSPGECFHWPAGIFHETINTGEEDFRHLLIANPDYESLDKKTNSDRSMKEQSVWKEENSDLIYRAVESIRLQFLENTHYSYVIFDTAGNMILQSRRYPAYCEACCLPTENEGRCPCMLFSRLENKDLRQSFACPFGMEVYHYPIMFRGHVLGYIQGGYIRRNSPEKTETEKNFPEVYEVPESVVAGIRALLGQIVKAVQNFCEFEQFREELLQRELKLTSSEESRQILMKNLQDARYAMTDLKINNHFLFNTLNGMASMALEAGVMPLYQSIVDLSKMFHYTLRTQSAIVTLQKELEYVKSYLMLQKLRYGDGLKIVYEYEQEVLSCQVPFNFLQPIIENAFVHGFQESEDKEIYISLRLKEGCLLISVCNNGKTMTEEMCRTINRRMRTGVSHGLSMIYLKLEAVYGEKFSFFAKPREKSGSEFLIQFPAADHGCRGGIE